MAFPLAALIAGDPVRGYQDSRKRSQSIDTGDVEAQGQAAAGNAYMGMFGGQQTPGAMPGAMPGAAPQQPPNMLAQLLQKLRGLGSPAGAPPAGQPSLPGPPQQGAAPPQSAIPGAQPMAPPGLSAMPPQMGQGGPPMGQPPTGPGTPPGAPMQGQMDWRMIVQQVIRANPGVKDPRVIAAAVDRFIPLMNSQSLMEWRQQQAQFRGFTAETGRERADTAREQGGERIQQGQQRIEQAGAREERLGRESILRNDRQHAMLDMQRQRLEQQIIQSKDRAQLGQWRALLDAQHKRATEIISSQAAGMDTKERKRLLDEEDSFYKDQIEMMKNNMQGGKTSGSVAPSDVTGHPPAKDQTRAPMPTTRITRPGAGEAPVKVQTPADAQKLAPGTRYVTPDGTEYTR